MIKDMFLSGEVNIIDQTYISNARHIAKLNDTLNSLYDSVQAINDQLPIDFPEIDLKTAWATLGEIIGDTSSTSLLDELFAKFCLGK
jgi:tRNA modification GTPase